MPAFSVDDLLGAPAPAPAPAGGAPVMMMMAGEAAMPKGAAAAAGHRMMMPRSAMRMAPSAAKAMTMDDLGVAMDVNEAALPPSEIVTTEEAAAEEDWDEADMSRRQRLRDTAGAGLFRTVGPTHELAETHYWARYASPGNGNAALGALVQTNEFWLAFARHMARLGGMVDPALTGADRMTALSRAAAAHPFVAGEFGLAGTNGLNEALLGVAVLGLPWEASPDHPPAPIRPQLSTDGDGAAVVRYAAGATPAVLFHQDVAPAQPVKTTTVLVGQMYFDPEVR